jgi:Short C-terminal domain
MLNPLTHRKVLKKGMPGRATVVEMGALDRGATSFNLPMTLQVHVEGITPYEVEGQWMVKAKDTVGLSGSIPVKVDQNDHEKVAIDWDGVRAEYEQEKAQRRDALAAGGSAVDQLGAGGMQAATPTIDMRNDPELRRKIEKIVGHELTPGSSETVAENDPQMQMQIMQTVQQHMAEKAAGGGFSQPTGGGGDDSVAKLERLAALKDKGAITDQEFEREKAKILGGS